MPEEWAHKLAKSGPESLNHLLPSLTGRWHWPEQRRSILLIGVRGELPMGHATESPSGAMIDPLADGEMAIGHELARDLDLKENSRVELGGRSWLVKTIYPMRANSDDISIWLPLATVQKLFDKPGKVNAILALQCNCRDADLMALVRQEVQAVLPGCVVLEKGSQALARAESRKAVGDSAKAQLELLKADRARQFDERSRLTRNLILTALAAGLFIFGLAAAGNANSRRQEIALLGSLGFRRSRIFVLLLSRVLLAALFAAFSGLALAAGISQAAFGTGLFELVAPAAIFSVLGAALPCALFAAWLPCLSAVRREPASLLKEERL
jgi:ABC-type lipoprotein release transport system permease subunit